MHRRTSLLGNTRFHVFWISAAAIGFGDQIVMNAAMAMVGGWKAGEDTTAAMGVNQFFFFLPYLILSAAGGWLADRAPRRWILSACEFARAAILLLAFSLLPASAHLTSAPADEQWKVFALLLAIGTCATFFYPARMACIPEVVGQDKVQAGNAIIASVTLIAAMISKLFIGHYMDPAQTDSIRTFLIVAVALYVVAGIAFACVRVDRRRDADLADDAHPSGFRYILGHRGAIAINALYLFIWAVAMVVLSAIPAIVKARFGYVDKALMASTLYLNAAIGVGLLLGAGIMMVLPSRRQNHWMMTAALAIVGINCAVLVASRWSPLTYAAAAILGIAGNMSMVGCLSALQTTTPDFMRGRVMGVNSMISTVGQIMVLFCVGFPDINKALDTVRLPSFSTGSIPPADDWILPLLLITSGILVLVGLFLSLRQLLRGPIHSPLANLIWRLNDLFTRQWHRLEVIGKAKVPTRGGAMLVLNHTTALDPCLAQGVSPQRMVRWLMIDKFHFKFLAPVWLATRPIVFKEGDRAQAQIRALVQAVEDGELIGIFPEGGLQRKERVLGRFGGGAAFIARKTGCPVVPVWIHGTTRANTLLAHLFWPSKCTVIVGTPLTCGPEEGEKAFTQRLRMELIKLSTQIPANRRRHPEVETTVPADH